MRSYSSRANSAERSDVPRFNPQIKPTLWMFSCWDRVEEEEEWVPVLQDLLVIVKDLGLEIASTTDDSPETICTRIAHAVSHPLVQMLVRRLQSTRGSNLWEFWCRFLSARGLQSGDPRLVPGFQLVRFVATALAAFPEKLDLPITNVVHPFESGVFGLARRLARSSATVSKLWQAPSMVPSDTREGSPLICAQPGKEILTASPQARRLAIVKLLKQDRVKEVQLSLSVTVGELACKYGGHGNWEVRWPNGGPTIFHSVTIGNLLQRIGVFQPPYRLDLELFEDTFWKGT